MPNLTEKLAAVAKTIPNLLKEGDNGQFKFLRAIDVFDAVRIKLFEAGIVVLPIACKSERSNPYLSITGDITDEWKMEVSYRITDGLEFIDCCAHGIGQDHEGKALYMASTGAKKDLLKSIFLIAGYEDDSEGVEDVARVAPGLAEKIAEMEKQFGPDSREWTIGRIEVNAWMSACRSSGYSQKAQKAFLKTCGVEKISDLKRKDFDRAMKWATGQEELHGEDSSGTEPDATD